MRLLYRNNMTNTNAQKLRACYVSRLIASHPALRFIDDHSGGGLIRFERGARFVDLRGVVFQLGGERRYLLLLLRDCCLQAFNYAIEHGLPGGIGNGLGPDVAFGRKSTRVVSIGGGRAQSAVGVDHHHSSRGGGNRRTKDVVDKAPVTFLAEYTVHSRTVSNDDIVIDAGDTGPGHAAYGNVITVAEVTLERLITDGCIGASGSVGSERFPPSGRVGAAAGIVHERKITGASVGATGVVKDERIGSHSGVLCAAGVEQERCYAHCRIGAFIVESKRRTANTGIETAARIQKQRSPTQCGIASADGERSKRVAPLSCCEIGITPVHNGWCWRWHRRGRGRGCGHRRG